MRPTIDILAGTRFGRWTVITEIAKSHAGQRYFACVCDCGIERSISIGSLRTGKSRSCGSADHRRRSGQLPITRTGNRFGELLKVYIKEQRGLSYTAVAHTLGVGSQDLTNFVYGLVIPGPVKVDQLAGALDATDNERRELHRAAALDRGYRID